MSKPTVGQSVHYHHNRHAEPQAAIVTKVWSDGIVNVALFNEDGSPVANPPTSLTFLQEGSSPPGGGPWCSPLPHEETDVARAARAGYLDGNRG